MEKGCFVVTIKRTSKSSNTVGSKTLGCVEEWNSASNGPLLDWLPSFVPLSAVIR